MIALSIGGPQPSSYRGPDGKPRFGNHRTPERGALRDIRQQAFAGKSMDDIASAYAAGAKLPGEDLAVHLLLGATPDAKRPPTPSSSSILPANDNETGQPAPAAKASPFAAGDAPPRAAIQLAQAENAGTQSDANPPLPPAQIDGGGAASGIYIPALQRDGPIPAHMASDTEPTYPSGALDPTCISRFVMGATGSH